MDSEVVDNLVVEASALADIDDKRLLGIKRSVSKKHQIQFFTNDILLRSYHKLVASGTIKPNQKLENLFRLKCTRSLSGIVVVSVLTKPYPCPGKCIYCPAQAGMPKSYLKNEPAVMRALTWAYDPYLQVQARLRALQETGHVIDKVSVRIIGGTWSYYDKRYQTYFVKRLFQAANEFTKSEKCKVESGKSGIEANKSSEKSGKLVEYQVQNEVAGVRIVELSVETRQDYINREELYRLRKLGVTKVELGVQSIYDDVLKLNKRGHNVESTVRATAMLKDAGFKVSYQLMLNLYGSDFERDIAMFHTLFNDPRFQPDHIKIYPLALVKESGMYKIYREGKFKPYNLSELTDLLVKVKQELPYYCRVERVIRDIPAESIVEGGAKSSNLRQVVQDKMIAAGLKCKCIRCREVRGGAVGDNRAMLFRQDYDASGGKEIFLSLESADRSTLHSFIRLRVVDKNHTPLFHALDGAALIREIHTYGPVVGIGQKSVGVSQHQGYGMRLLAEAERIANLEFKLSKMAVIAGVGVREYFCKHGYELEDTYMVKKM